MFERAEEESYKDLINQVEIKEITILLRNISRKIDLIDYRIRRYGYIRH